MDRGEPRTEKGEPEGPVAAARSSPDGECGLPPLRAAHVEAHLERAVAEVVAASVSEELEEHGLATLVASRLAGLLDTSSAGVVRFELAGGR